MKLREFSQWGNFDQSHDFQTIEKLFELFAECQCLNYFLTAEFVFDHSNYMTKSLDSEDPGCCRPSVVETSSVTC